MFTVREEMHKDNMYGDHLNSKIKELLFHIWDIQHGDPYHGFEVTQKFIL